MAKLRVNPPQTVRPALIDALGSELERGRYIGRVDGTVVSTKRATVDGRYEFGVEREDDELGIVRLCTRCQEEWPKDGEFWYFQHSRVLGHCKACWSERERIVKPQTPGFRLVGKRAYA